MPNRGKTPAVSQLWTRGSKEYPRMERTAKAQLSGALSLSFCDLIHPYPRQQLLTGDFLLHILPAGLACRPPPRLELFPGHILSAALPGILSIRTVPAGIDLVVFGKVFFKIIVISYLFVKEYFWPDFFAGPIPLIGPVAEFPPALVGQNKVPPAELAPLDILPVFQHLGKLEEQHLVQKLNEVIRHQTDALAVLVHDLQ